MVFCGNYKCLGVISLCLQIKCDKENGSTLFCVTVGFGQRIQDAKMLGEHRVVNQRWLYDSANHVYKGNAPIYTFANAQIYNFGSDPKECTT